MQTDGILRYVGYSNEPFTDQLQSNDMRNRLMEIVYAFNSSEGLKTLICIETISSKIEIITNFLIREYLWGLWASMGEYGWMTSWLMTCLQTVLRAPRGSVS